MHCLSQTAAHDHVDILTVITACPLQLLLETWSGWPFCESQDGVSLFTAALSLDWWSEERLLFSGSDQSGCSHRPHAILNPLRIFFNRRWGERCISLERFALIAAFKTMYINRQWKIAVCMCKWAEVWEANVDVRLWTCTFTPEGKISAQLSGWECEHCGIHILLMKTACTNIRGSIYLMQLLIIHWSVYLFKWRNQIFPEFWSKASNVLFDFVKRADRNVLARFEVWLRFQYVY